METYTLQEFMDAFSFSNPDIVTVLIVSGITFFFGYLQYMYSLRIVIREKKAPFPVWMHTFYFAHDFTSAMIFFNLARENDNFWIFNIVGIAMLIWCSLEVWSFYMTVKYERQEIWGYDKGGKEVSKEYAIFNIVMQVILMFGIVNVARIFMGDVAMVKWWLFTNVVMCTVPGIFWIKRNTRSGASVGLGIVLVLTAIATFIPGSMWTLISDSFNQPWYYALGVVVLAIAVRNLIVLLKLPPKEHIPGEKKPIW